ncbi:MAG: M18 family aminopeptidase, partial [Ilumatobacteraceae bacterium]
MNVDSLIDDVDRCPTANHVVGLWADRLLARGFSELTDLQAPPTRAGFLRRSGLLVAWRNMDEFADLGARIIGAHTDSPGLHLKPNPNRSSLHHGQLAVEVYGSPILSSWFDRDLGLAGTVVGRDRVARLVHVDRPIARLPHLAIHLDRELNDRGHLVDRHRHLSPVWSVEPADVTRFIAEAAGVPLGEMDAMSIQLVDVQRGSRLGNGSEFVSSPRLDNQVSCWASMHALLDPGIARPALVVLFDHEEVGSSSPDGAASPILEHLLESFVNAAGGSRASYLAGVGRSHLLSMDNSHGVHPNHPEKHDLDNAPTIGAGVAVKINVNQRYATSTRSLPIVQDAALRAGITLQRFSSRNDIGCGSTIGPIAATRLGIDTVDV